MPPDPFQGTQYRVTRQLGAGGMGEVYEVAHEIVGRLMVAKVLRAELAHDTAIADRMRVEAQAPLEPHTPTDVEQGQARRRWGAGGKPGTNDGIDGVAQDTLEVK